MRMTMMRMQGTTWICCLLHLSIFSNVDGHWNLLMNEGETKKLLGIPGELFYIKQGVVNEYALSFSMTIQPEIDEVYFDWHNDRQQLAVTPQIMYSVNVHLSNPHALLRPYLNIPSHGMVPYRRTSFALLLKCSGDITADVDIQLIFEFSSSSSNLTRLEIKRKKICVRETNRQKTRAGSAYRTSEPTFVFGKDVYSHNREDATQGSLSKKYQFIIVGCGVGFFLIVAVVVVYCCCRKRKRTTGFRNGSCPPRTAPPPPLKSNEGQNYCTYTSTNDSLSSGSSIQQQNFSCHKPTYQEAVYLLNEIKFNRNLITLGEVILQGLHGSFYRGFVNVLSPNRETVAKQQVIIKTFLDESNFDPVSSSMLTDACLLRGLAHANLSPCIGACLDHFPMMILYEDAGLDVLKMFLSRLRNVEVLSPQQLTYLALQIARGLAFLHSKKILHKDVATRNCLVTTNLQVRLGDSFLSSDIFPDDYYPSQNGEQLPIRWMAIESIADGSHTPASDIWSLGVLIWELFSLAEQPYDNVGAAEMAHHLIKGFRLQQPRTCPSELFAMTSQCWLVSPGERPRMNHLLTFIVNFYNTLSRFV